MPDLVALTFPRELRLLTPNDFRFVFQEPKFAGSPQVSILGRKNSFEHPRLGLVVAKKVAKRANARNRIKRLVRESFRLRQHQLPATDFVVIAKKGVTDLDNRQFTELINKLWDRHIRWASSSSSQ